MSYRTDECPSCVFEGLKTPVVPELVKTLLVTNDPPGDTILPSLLSTLNAAVSVSESVGKCIATTQAVLEKMKDACTLSIKQHKAAIHPLRSIPDDRHIARSGAVYMIHHPLPIPLGHSLASVVGSHFLASTMVVVPNDERYRGFMVSMQARARWIAIFPSVSRKTLVEHAVADDGTLEVPRAFGECGALMVCSFDRLTELVWTLPFPFHPDPETVSMFKSARNLRRLTLRDSMNANIDLLWNQITDYTTDIFGISNLPKLTAVQSMNLSFFTYVDETALWRTLQDTFSASVSLPSVRFLSMKQSGGTLPFLLHTSRLLHIPSVTSLSIIAPARIPKPTSAPPTRILCTSRRDSHIPRSVPFRYIAVHLKHDRRPSLGVTPNELGNPAIALISYPLRALRE